jgi:hypothetical protein
MNGLTFLLVILAIGFGGPIVAVLIVWAASKARPDVYRNPFGDVPNVPGRE